MIKKYQLYLDETGSREPDAHPPDRQDSMNCFGLGGVLIREEDIGELVQKHKDFCAKWKIDYPLHSTKIRGGRGKFSWLKRPENANAFLPALQDFLLSLSVVGIACIVDRPGYVTRYKCRYHDGLWYMCKTTFCILVERAAKFTDAEDRRLEIYFEEAGKWEGRRITEYIRQLKQV